jgi:general secretion pathway protein I
MSWPQTVRPQAGFSLLELLVAIAILGVSLAALYQSVSGATRNVRIDRDTLYAAELARSLVAEHALVSPGGINLRGETAGGFRWQAVSQPVELPLLESLVPGALHQLDVEVRWDDGRRERRFGLTTVVPSGEMFD